MSIVYSLAFRNKLFQHQNFTSYLFIMAVDKEVSEMIMKASGLGQVPAADAVADALKEINTLFSATNDSLVAICESIEHATTRSQLKVAFARLDSVMRILFGMAPEKEHEHVIRDALVNLDGDSP